MKISDCSNWLLENGGPIIRHLITHNPISAPNMNEDRPGDELMHSDEVRYWQGCLTGDMSFNGIHGSRDICFENAMGKLSLFGLRRGVDDLDRLSKPYLLLLANSSKDENVIMVLYRTIIAAMLAMSGYLTAPGVREWILQRLETVNKFVNEHESAIYVEKSKFKHIPSALKNYQVVNPDLYRDGEFALPWIYDIFAFSILSGQTKDQALKTKIEGVISYVLDARYQRLPDGYGIVVSGKNRYNVMGWSVWLPCFNGMHEDDFKLGCLVQRLELMSRFPSALDSNWFISSLNYLEQYRTDGGRYLFPRHYIKEKKNSFFVTGAHMGVGESRRCRSAYEIESTFWMLKIMSNVMANTGTG